MSHDDFEIEPVEGLPETPPKGEVILWQGRPDWRQLAWESLSLPWVIGYFAVLAIWRFLSVIDLMPLGQALGATLPFLIMGGVVVALLVLTALAQARSAMYTVTNRRVAMRIGAALTMTLNLPYTQIANAMLDLRRGGTGTIAFETMGDTRLSYLLCWPHLRPWHMKATQPALRCIPDAERVAALISDAAQARIAEPRLERKAPMRAGVAVAAE
ncbi:MAG: photosynthetic complex putative assembly protein PuhB [Proteobacteria bacterium]|nr:photosynthetic complex putative assembly protein PuhB [Pseudomonadota bacterium]